MTIYLFSADSNKVVCDQCGYHCHSVNELRRHQSTHSSDRRHICEVCAKSFKVGGKLLFGQVEGYFIFLVLTRRSMLRIRFPVFATSRNCNDVKLFATMRQVWMAENQSLAEARLPCFNELQKNFDVKIFSEN